jgi:hypothetical protein
MQSRFGNGVAHYHDRHVPAAKVSRDLLELAKVMRDRQQSKGWSKGSAEQRSFEWIRIARSVCRERMSLVVVSNRRD